jgi:hypothetical protein
MHLTLFDYGDPRLDTKLDDCFGAVVDKVRNQARSKFGLSPDQLPSQPSEIRRFIARQKELLEGITKETYKKCIEDSRSRNFAKSNFIIGGATSWISKNGDSGKFVHNGTEYGHQLPMALDFFL